MIKEQTDVNIKQRLIGAIVLVSLGVIIIPLLLNSGSDSQHALYSQQAIYGSNIPPLPAELNKKLPEIAPIKNVPPPEAVESIPVERVPTVKKPIKQVTQENLKVVTHKVTVSRTVKQANVVPAEQFKSASKPKSKTISQAYTLQIASFSNSKNAFTLRDKLRKESFKAYIESVKTSKGKIYRLRVGPYLKYEQIVSIQKKIEKQFQLKKTIIVNYKT